MKSLQADFFKVMKEGAIQYAAPLPFLDLICVGTATQTEVEASVCKVLLMAVAEPHSLVSTG